MTTGVCLNGQRPLTYLIINCSLVVFRFDLEVEI